MTIYERSSLWFNQLPKVRGSYRFSAELAPMTWFRVGGEADILYRPEDIEDLCYFLEHKPKDLPCMIMGVASNLLIRDGGIAGVVIRLGRAFTHIKHDENRNITVGAASLSFNAARYACEYSIAGLEFLSGIPGTIGGALAMNAGAYGNEVADILVKAQIVDEAGQTHWLNTEDIGYVYRGNTLPENIIFTQAVFRGKLGNKEVIQARMEEIAYQRQASQPIRSRTGGSTFTNPPGNKRAWELIDQAGCRGLLHGGAQISEKHCNFMINTGNASAKDLEELGEIVREKVKECCGLTLEWEIKRVGRMT